MPALATTTTSWAGAAVVGGGTVVAGGTVDVMTGWVVEDVGDVVVGRSTLVGPSENVPPDSASSEDDVGVGVTEAAAPARSSSLATSLGTCVGSPVTATPATERDERHQQKWKEPAHLGATLWGRHAQTTVSGLIGAGSSVGVGAGVEP